MLLRTLALTELALILSGATGPTWEHWLKIPGIVSQCSQVGPGAPVRIRASSVSARVRSSIALNTVYATRLLSRLRPEAFRFLLGSDFGHSRSQTARLTA